MSELNSNQPGSVNPTAHQPGFPARPKTKSRRDRSRRRGKQAAFPEMLVHPSTTNSQQDRSQPPIQQPANPAQPPQNHPSTISQQDHGQPSSQQPAYPAKTSTKSQDRSQSLTKQPAFPAHPRAKSRRDRSRRRGKQVASPANLSHTSTIPQQDNSQPSSQQPASPAILAHPSTTNSQLDRSQPTTQQPAHPAQPQQDHPTTKSQQNRSQPPAQQQQPIPGPIQQQPDQRDNAQQSHQQQPNWSANFTNFQDYLTHTSSFHVQQKLDLPTGYEAENEYVVRDQNGNELFSVIEESHICGRICCGRWRAFALRVRDARGVDVLRIERGVDCTFCCGLILPNSIRITDAYGNLLGTVDEGCNILYPKYELKDARGVTGLKADGPGFVFSCGWPLTFNVLSLDNARIGRLSKEWKGFIQETFTDADYFAMTFPQDLSPDMKAVCLGLLFLIDFHYFETCCDTCLRGCRSALFLGCAIFKSMILGVLSIISGNRHRYIDF